MICIQFFLFFFLVWTSWSWQGRPSIQWRLVCFIGACLSDLPVEVRSRAAATCCEPPQPTTNSTCRLNMTCSDIMWHTYHPPSLDSKLRPGSQLPPSMTPGAQAIERMPLSRAVGSRRKHPRRASWTPTSPEPWKITLSHLIFNSWLILVDRFP